MTFMPIDDGILLGNCGFCGICYIKFYLACLANNYWPVSCEVDSLNYYFDNDHIFTSYVISSKNHNENFLQRI